VFKCRNARNQEGSRKDEMAFVAWPAESPGKGNPVGRPGSLSNSEHKKTTGNMDSSVK